MSAVQGPTHNGRFEFSFNNAGVGATQPFVETTVERWGCIIDVNLRSVIDCTAVAYQLMADTALVAS